MAGEARKDVVANGQSPEQSIVLELERSADAEACGLDGMDFLETRAIENNIAGISAIHSVDHIEERTFASPVRADQCANLAARDVEAEAGQRGDPLERERDVVKLENGVRHGFKFPPPRTHALSLAPYAPHRA
jgi:hypothetical protein